MSKVFIVAELSANHGQDIKIAKASIRAAKESGADAVKLQTYTADTLTIDCDNQWFKINQGTLWDGRTLYDLYKEAYTPWEWHEELFAYGDEIGIEVFSTPFDFSAVDLLEALNVKRYKIASFEITDIPLISYTASKGKPMILSTGIATLEEIGEAVNACKDQGNHQITLLQCTSQYPANIEDANLSNLVDLKRKFHVDTGLSDHTIGDEASVFTVLMGACMVEKHFILNREIGGPDAAFSMEPKDFKIMVEKIRRGEKILGTPDYEMTQNKQKNRKFARSLFVVEDVKKGEIFTSKNIRSIRPGDGISPKYYEKVLGKKAEKDVLRGTPLSLEHVRM